MNVQTTGAGRARRALLLAFAGLAASACTHQGVADGGAATARPRPNVLVILADDLGYSDIGAYGGEIPTPNLDALAREGRLLTNHYVAPTCSPTRAMLMSGTDNHRAGLGSMAEVIASGDGQPLRGKPGYEGYLNESVPWLPQLLRDSGYHTYMAGKWHLGMQPQHWPVNRGFEASFALLPGAGHHFAPDPGRPVPADATPHVENDQRAVLPQSFYSSDYFTDKLLTYLERGRADGKPFFAYLAYTAPHWPIQAPDADIALFKGRYDAGYAAVRDARLARQQALGLLPAGFKPYATLPPSKEFPSWSQLTPEQRQVEARKMEVYAAMVHNMDRNIGRVLKYLKDTGQYERTLIVFQSDNGSEPTPSFFPSNRNVDNSLANIGRRFSNTSYGPRWAEVSATPLRHFKGWTSEGGIASPTIVRMPGGRTPLPMVTQATHVTDLAPTILDIAGVSPPSGQSGGRAVLPMSGTSLLPVLRGSGALPQRPLAGELFGGRWLREGRWKLVSVREPFGSNTWELYDLETDRGENVNLAARHPEVVHRLAALYDRYAQANGIIQFANKMPNAYWGATDSGLGTPPQAATPGPQR